MPSRNFAWLARPNETSTTSAMQANAPAIMVQPPSSGCRLAVLEPVGRAEEESGAMTAGQNHRQPNAIHNSRRIVDLPHPLPLPRRGRGLGGSANCSRNDRLEARRKTEPCGAMVPGD